MPSIREDVANNLADTCIFGSLNDSYGVLKEKTVDKAGKSHWSITFCRARILDGEIKVYQPNYIRISWQTAIRDLPAKGSQVFKSEQEAKAFLMRFIAR